MPTPWSDLHVLQRGWLSSNNIVLRDPSGGGWLIDSSHVLHAEQTLSLVRNVLAGQTLHGVLNTHLHSDHCGGNASVQRAFGAGIRIPPGGWDAVCAWDAPRLSFHDTGQRCERFRPDAPLVPGQTLSLGSRCWDIVAAPGHDPDSVMFFDAHEGLLISADALWENGYGVIFPELDGHPGFDDVDRVLTLIQRLDARQVIPGHGAPFTDVTGALQRARRRLAAQRADPARHAWHGARVLVKYHLMEERSQPWPAFVHWFCATPLCERVWTLLGHPMGSLAAFGTEIVRQLCDSGALRREDAMLVDAG